MSSPFFFVGLITTAPVQFQSDCNELWERKVDAYSKDREVIDRATGKGAKQAYDIYEPEWHCERESRVGSNGGLEFGDGPKWICGVEELSKMQNCLVYSIGSNYDFRFERGIQSHANCEIHTFDGTMNLFKRPLPKDLHNINFHNWNMAEKQSVFPSKSIRNTIKTLGHHNKNINIFKIDCEGCEHEILPQLMDIVRTGDIKVGQILVEMHGRDVSAIANTFKSMRSNDMMIFHKERNHWGCEGWKCVEFSLVSMSWAKRAFMDSHC